MPLRRPAGLLMCAALAGCAQFPELDAATSPAARDAPYPDLIPVEDIMTQVPQARITPDTANGLGARVAALRARAARLRGAVIDSPTRARMRAGVDGAG